MSRAAGGRASLLPVHIEGSDCQIPVVRNLRAALEAIPEASPSRGEWRVATGSGLCSVRRRPLSGWSPVPEFPVLPRRRVCSSVLLGRSRAQPSAIAQPPAPPGTHSVPNPLPGHDISRRPHPSRLPEPGRAGSNLRPARSCAHWPSGGYS